MKIFLCYCLEALTGQSLLKYARHLAQHEHENWSNTCTWAQMSTNWSSKVAVMKHLCQRQNTHNQTPLKESSLLLSLKLFHSSYLWHTWWGMGFKSFFGMGHYVHLMACLGGWHTATFSRSFVLRSFFYQGVKREEGGREGRGGGEVKQTKLFFLHRLSPPIATGCSFYFSRYMKNYLFNWMWLMATRHDTARTEPRFSKTYRRSIEA